MSGPTNIDPRAAVRTAAPTGSSARPNADQPARTWLCSFCGLLRVYDGGRPLGYADRNDCRECGARLAATPEDRAAIDMGRRASMERELF